MASTWTDGDRVKCLATRFDEDSEDFQGRKFSERHALEGHGSYVHGTVKRVLRNRTVKVLHDGDARQHASGPSHLLRSDFDDSSSSSGEDSDDPEDPPSHSDASESHPDSGDEGPVHQDGTPDADADDDNENGEESEGDEGEDAMENMCRVGSSVEVHGNTWKRVKTMGDCSRGAKARKKFSLKTFTFTSETTKKEIWEHVLPVTLHRMLAVVKENAQTHNDNPKCYTDDGLLCFFALLHAGCQFTAGCDAWRKKRKGMMPPPDFGRVMSHDRFDRWLRHLAEGPQEDRGKDDPWHPIRWLVDGFNASRKRNCDAGHKIVVDETMWQWRSGSIPHLSHVPRKPEPFGLEIKNACCADSNVVLHMELQEGKVRMARKRHCRDFQATTACTLRLTKGARGSEKGVEEADCVKRVCTGDSWFASVATATALKTELNVDFVGTVKTATKGFPQEAIRRVLSTKRRGDHCVFHCADLGLHAVGWHDWHYKTCVSSCYTTDTGPPSKKKRQRDDGANYHVEVRRPEVIAELQNAAQGIDGHNQLRQGNLKLESFWKVKKWEKRMVTSMMSTCLVDSFNVWEHYHEVTAETRAACAESRVINWACDLIEELCPSLTSLPDNQLESQHACHLVKLPTTITKSGAHVGREYRQQQRCSMCIKAGRTEKPGSTRAPKTLWKCAACSPEVRMCDCEKSVCFSEHKAEMGQ